jgi:ribosome recycling factor
MKNKIIKVNATIKIDTSDLEKIKEWDPKTINSIVEEIREMTFKTKIKDGIKITVSVPEPTCREMFNCVAGNRRG